MYGREQLDDMIENEYKTQYDALLSRQTKITREFRASLIDWIFEVAAKMNL